ncbi:MAG: PTS sugar transporter subunit IIA [Myxococcales bacterium]|nr:PTS sugar transporter subunit IIA [Myxococcales bacterium]MCB9648904.1 PTS sugar transporter subunit IIA [Deltaproteobacteria bacterium]
MLRLSELLDAGAVVLDLQAQDVPDLLHRVVEPLVTAGRLDAEAAEGLAKALLERELQGCTGVGLGVALPHAYVDQVPTPMMLIARLATPIAYGQCPDGKPVDLVFLLTGPDSAKRTHVKVLAKLVRLLHDGAWVEALRAATSPDTVREAMQAVEARHA